jgi:hypothetical protein
VSWSSAAEGVEVMRENVASFREQGMDVVAGEMERQPEKLEHGHGIKP